MKEKTQYKKLKQLSAYFRFIRIESPTEVGIPDIYYYSIQETNKSGWIENKQAYIKYNALFIRYEPGQIKFLEELSRHNPRVFVMIAYDKVLYLTKRFIKFFPSIIELSACSLWKGESVLNNDFIELLDNGEQ
jgi:hypothetical protein